MDESQQPGTCHGRRTRPSITTRKSAATPSPLVIFQTDSGPSSKIAADRCLRNAARPPAFWQFMDLGDLATSNSCSSTGTTTWPPPLACAVDNAGFFRVSREVSAFPAGLLDGEILQEIPGWLSATRSAQVLR